jgi:hypothetical protein
MRPSGNELLSRLRAILARVRWENVALIVLIALAFVAALMGERLLGHGSSGLPADVGLSSDSPQREGAQARDRAKRLEVRPGSQGGRGRPPTRAKRRGLSSARDKRRGRSRPRGARPLRGDTRGPPAVAEPGLQPTPPPGAPPPAGSEFAPE